MLISQNILLLITFSYGSNTPNAIIRCTHTKSLLCLICIFSVKKQIRKDALQLNNRLNKRSRHDPCSGYFYLIRALSWLILALFEWSYSAGKLYSYFVTRLQESKFVFLCMTGESSSHFATHLTRLNCERRKLIKQICAIISLWASTMWCKPCCLAGQRDELSLIKLNFA